MQLIKKYNKNSYQTRKKNPHTFCKCFISNLLTFKVYNNWGVINILFYFKSIIFKSFQELKKTHLALYFSP